MVIHEPDSTNPNQGVLFKAFIPEHIAFTTVEAVLPVFLPSSDGTREVVGKAVIDATGHMEIDLSTPGAADRLVHVISEGMLRGVSFDYRSAQPACDFSIDRNEHRFLVTDSALLEIVQKHHPTERQISPIIIPYLDN